MPAHQQHHQRRGTKLMWAIACLLVIVIGFVVFEGLFVIYNGTNVPTPTIPRQPITQGSGAPLSYVVLGDSSAVAQGADYANGYAMGTTQHLAKDHQVTMTNVAVSGARAKDVLDTQVAPALQHKPDLVLLAVGGNDVTHLTSARSLEHSLQGIAERLIKQNCDIKIVVTGAPQMGSVARFPQPLRALAGLRTKQLNKVFDSFTTQQQITFARIADQTGTAFRKDSSLFAQDKFHPNANGYAVWTPVLNQAIDQALAEQPSHCPKD